MNPLDVLASRVTVTGFCWLWGDDPGVYGRVTYQGRTRIAHRWVYELLVGPIPEGYDLDHLCRVRNCVNPDHLEPVTRSENMSRGLKGFDLTGRCRSGKHLITGSNLIHRSDGARQCADCQKDYSRKRTGAVIRCGRTPCKRITAHDSGMCHAHRA